MMKLLAALAVGGMVLAGCSSSRNTPDDPVHPKGQVKMAKEVDPVCGMEVAPAGAPREQYQGQWFYFCSEDCEDRFKAAPAAHVTRIYPPADVK